MSIWVCEGERERQRGKKQQRTFNRIIIAVWFCIVLHCLNFNSINAALWWIWFVAVCYDYLFLFFFQRFFDARFHCAKFFELEHCLFGEHPLWI